MDDWFFKNAEGQSSDVDSLLIEERSDDDMEQEELDFANMKPKLIKNVGHFIYQVT
jgi:hypothetical protein